MPWIKVAKTADIPTGQIRSFALEGHSPLAIAHLEDGFFVIDAITNYYQNDNANIHRGVYTLAERATQKYEEAREKVAKFIGATTPREVVFTSGTTGSLNLVAQSWGRANLKKGDTVLLTVMEHHSNLVPWQILSKELGFSLEFIHVTKDGLLEDAEGTIRRVKPKLLAFTHVSNVLGTVNSVKDLTKAAHERSEGHTSELQ